MAENLKSTSIQKVKKIYKKDVLYSSNKELLEGILKQFKLFSLNYEKADKGLNAAEKRIRTITINLEILGKEYRKKSIIAKKQFKKFKEREKNTIKLINCDQEFRKQWIKNFVKKMVSELEPEQKALNILEKNLWYKALNKEIINQIEAELLILDNTQKNQLS